MRLIAAILTGRATESPAFDAWRAKRLEVRSLAGPLRTARDGEVSAADVEGFVVEKRPRALVVYAG